MTGHHQHHVDVKLLPSAPACPRCTQPGILAVRIPRTDAPNVGGLPPVAFQAVLCHDCHRDDPYAAALVLFFTVHGTLEENTLSSFANLLRRWVDHLDIPAINDASIAADIAAWRGGEFD